MTGLQEPANPADEHARLLELYSLGVLDTGADARFDDISELARRIAGTEIAIISLVDANRQWFKSCVGVPLAQEETPRRISFCGHTILQRDPLIVDDCLEDPRFAGNPLVGGDPHIRFYAGFPLITTRGFAVGSLCVISREPHQLDQQQIDSLTQLTLLTVGLLEGRPDAGRPAGRTLGQEPERRGGASPRRLSSLERLISRDQMVQMLDLLFPMDVGSPFAVMRCRFRDYERINATLGGRVAEDFINEAARRMFAALPRAAAIARFADAELVVLLPFQQDQSAVEQLAERVIAFSGQPHRSGSQALSMGVAIGLAICRQNDQSAESILADTSMALRMASRRTASACCLIDAEARVAAQQSYRLESDFRDAVAGKLLVPYLQPIVDLASSETVGFEALARWPQNGEVLQPSHFLPLALETGLTGELDLLILEKALAALPLLAQPIPRREMTLSANLSGTLLEDPQLRERLLNLIDETPIPPGWTLQVELVEDIFQYTDAAFDQFLDALVHRGVRIALDDFGTGYSSLARLISLPIQIVKVDQTFVARLSGQQDSPRTLLRTMLTMLQDLGLATIAEGVECADQRDWLLQNGVAKAQGYLFSPPVSVSEAIEQLQQQEFRPPAIPVEASRLRALRRRLPGHSWAADLLGRFRRGRRR